MSIRVVLADSSPLYRRGIAMVLERFSEKVELVEADSYEALMVAVAQQTAIGLTDKQTVDSVSLLVIDDLLGGLSSLKQVGEVIARSGSPVLMTVSLATDKFVRDAFKAGCQGVVRKSVSADVMERALRVLLEGGSWHPARETQQWLLDEESRAGLIEAIPQLSRQERVVLELVRQGAMNKTIASSMQISENTVKSHVSRIFRKLRVENRTKLVLAVQSMQLLESAALCRSL
ncbi:response regulator transcription factor [Motiliproteus sp. MSK22-1]|uniref:response regulator transcription factor n=1 Tax=Motiliproteus sp. MSK22-1 TaxID=1897630 RepID=UPI0009758F42|nr:response regulator transcription factor [Motiliproteus sp. MSK22-1]OMH30787.1 hypothetical protein BGP75_17325 [Motiliproteus sp. MSK22-1]